MTANRNLISHNVTFRVYWLARSISGIGDFMAQIALVLLVYHMNRSPLSVSMLLLAQVIPRIVGPFTGTLADKLEQKRLLIVCDILQFLLFTIMGVAHAPFVILLLLVVVSALISSISAPAGSSALPLFVDQEELLTANLLIRSSGNVSMMAAPAIGGALSVAFGPSVVLLVDASTFLLSALLLIRLPNLKSAQAETLHIFHDTYEGLLYIVKTPLVRRLVLSLWIYVAFAAIDNLALVFLAHVSLHAGDRGYGWLASAYGAGMLLGSAILYRFRNRLAPMKALYLGLNLFGVGSLLTGIAPTLWIALFVQAIAAFGNSFENVGTDTVVQQMVPDQLLGRVFGTLFNGMEVAAGVAYLAGGVLLHLLSPREVFLVSGGIVILSTLFTMRMVRPQ